MAFVQIRGGGKYDLAHREYVCDTEDDLPEILDAYNVLPLGTVAKVIDTGDVYMLNGSNEWVKQPACGGGGGSGGGADIFMVRFTMDISGGVVTTIADKTVAEIFDAAKSGALVKGVALFGEEFGYENGMVTYYEVYECTPESVLFSSFEGLKQTYDDSRSGVSYSIYMEAADGSDDVITTYSNVVDMESRDGD